MKRITVRYAHYGSHTIHLEVENSATDEEIERLVRDALIGQMDYSWEYAERK